MLQTLPQLQHIDENAAAAARTATLVASGSLQGRKQSSSTTSKSSEEAPVRVSVSIGMLIEGSCTVALHDIYQLQNVGTGGLHPRLKFEALVPPEASHPGKDEVDVIIVTVMRVIDVQ
jgi:hypothetical protein